jgi:flagellin-like protein
METGRDSLGVSPIIATLLLIAITVAAGVIVYVFVSGTIGNLTQGGGQQTAQQIELTSYAFSPLTGTSITCDTNATVDAPCILISFKNTGGSSATIDSLYLDGTLLTKTGTFASGCVTLSTDHDCDVLLVASGVTIGYDGVPSGIVGGSTNTLKIVTATGGIFAYTLTAGSSQ